MRVVYQEHDPAHLNKGACLTSEQLSQLAVNGCGIGLGNFDGVHIGHRALAETLIARSSKFKLNSIIYTFYPHPLNILRGDNAVPILTPIPKKARIFRDMGLDMLYFAKFTPEMAAMSPEDFIKQILVDKFHMRLAVVGFDYRFGSQASGDVDCLYRLGRKYGFEVIVIPPVRVDDEVVGSTELRLMIQTGDMEKATKFLGRYYSLQGRVAAGRQVGRKLGYPTANLIIEDNVVVPARGVYASQVELDGCTYDAVTNVGINPTFSLEKLVVETHILDFSGDIYDKDIEVFFVRKLRDEKKFDSVEELKQAIENDIAAIRSRR